MSRAALLLLGAGGHAKVVLEAAAAGDRWRRFALLDDRYPSHRSLLGWPVLGGCETAERWLDDYPEAALGLGDNGSRLAGLRRLERCGFGLPCVVHPRAWVSASAVLAAGCVVLAQAAVSAEARLGRGCIVNTGATVDHDCELAEGVHVAPGAHLAAGVRVGRGSSVGVGASVRQQISIGCDVVIGAGGAVVADVADGCTVVGVPAKPVDR